MIINQDKKEIRGTIFDVQGLSVHDGPGCRTLIFLNGCTLNCFWCSNPEGISRKPVPMYYHSRCISCNNCINECPEGAIKREEGELFINRKICLTCENKSCVSVCYTDGLKLSGYEITTEKLLNIIQRDRQFWGSEGGITLSGGEPLMQIDFAEEILRRSYESYIHTAIETCGNIPFTNLQRVIPYLDWIFFDLKHFDSEKHKEGTNADNLLIIENAKQLAKEFNGRIIFRLPLIPQFNDSMENINSIISFLKEVGRNEINILPLHHLGREKYKIINREYTGLNYLIPSIEKMQKVKQIFTEAGIICHLGGETPF
ncbi:glycyl-radical enzyme activating protein [bacterium]|nr:glycyl-radical enzyme activating protein [bacterium]MBU1064276.1 glycyl-radical enzyme activating protein [bacterium]MBU1633481.1 glycyl-radical enzyme activating protein [bacterium]MBU1873911.1 glycyl-radical enzyme activating protein [bacterium]